MHVINLASVCVCVCACVCARVCMCLLVHTEYKNPHSSSKVRTFLGSEYILAGPHNLKVCLRVKTYRFKHVCVCVLWLIRHGSNNLRLTLMQGFTVRSDKSHSRIIGYSSICWGVSKQAPFCDSVLTVNYQ